MANNITDKQTETDRYPNRWKPGHSGNPAGRPPRGKAISDHYWQMLEDNPELIKAIGATMVKLIIENKDLNAIKEFTDRIEGKSNQTSNVDITSGGRPIPLLNTLNVPDNNGTQEAEKTE